MRGGNFCETLFSIGAKVKINLYCLKSQIPCSMAAGYLAFDFIRLNGNILFITYFILIFIFAFLLLPSVDCA